MLLNLRNLLVKLIILVITLGVTLFIVLSTVEIVGNVDIPYISAMAPIKAQDAVNKIVRYSDESGFKDFGNKRYVNLGQIDYLYFPNQNYRVFTGKSRKVKEYSTGIEKWFMKPNNAHSIILNRDKSGIEGDYLIYTDQSWKTIPNAALINTGDKIQVINTRGDLFQFSIIERQELKYSESYIPQTSNDRQIILIIEDKNSDRYTAFTARPS
jgi:hypothetical protein